MNPPDPAHADDRSVTAGEYVLGTLDTATAARFEQALAQDPALRAEVAGWQDRLLGLSRHAAPFEPTPGLWAALERRLPAQPQTRLPPPQLASAGPQALIVRPATPRRPDAPSPQRWWQQLPFWQGLSGLAVAASVLMGNALLLQGQATLTVDERYVAVLQAPEGGGNGWVVEVKFDRSAGSGRQGKLRLVPVAPGAVTPSGRTLQFWTKVPGASSPRSLGLVRTGTAVDLPLDRLPDMRPEQLFEITLEPQGGSPLDRPTGPVLFIGRAVKLSS
jgi:anti-sigma-K factor RskA